MKDKTKKRLVLAGCAVVMALLAVIGYAIRQNSVLESKQISVPLNDVVKAEGSSGNPNGGSAVVGATGGYLIAGPVGAFAGAIIGAGAGQTRPNCAIVTVIDGKQIALGFQHDRDIFDAQETDTFVQECMQLEKGGSINMLKITRCNGSVEYHWKWFAWTNQVAN